MVNILTAALSYKGRAIPLFAELVKRMVKGDCMILYNPVVTRGSEFVMNVLLTWGAAYDEPLVVMTKNTLTKRL